MLKRAVPPVQGAGPPTQRAGPMVQGVGSLVPATILDGTEPELGAELNGERPDFDPQGDPGPEYQEDAGIKSCVCPKSSSYRDCMDSESCPAASSKRAALAAVVRCNNTYDAYKTFIRDMNL